MTIANHHVLSMADYSLLALRGAPIVCFDTCSVLDVFRDPTREKISAHEQHAAIELVAAMENKNTLVGLIANQVQLEFDEHADVVASESAAALVKLQRHVGSVDTIAAVFGVASRADMSHLNGHVDRARAVANRLMAAAHRVPSGTDVPSRAFARVQQCRTPAQKGKESMKDCVVIESYLEAVSALRAAGLTSKIVFVSSNTKDYAQQRAAILKDDLAADFAKLQMDYAPNLAAAKYLLSV